MDPKKFYFFNKIINPKTANKYRHSDVRYDDKQKNFENGLEREYSLYMKNIEKEKKIRQKLKIENNIEFSKMKTKKKVKKN